MKYTSGDLNTVGAQNPNVFGFPMVHNQLVFECSLDFEWSAIFSSDIEWSRPFENRTFKMTTLAKPILYTMKKKFWLWNWRQISLWDHGYIDICGRDHSKSKTFKNWTLKRSVLGWRSVLQVRILTPHCSEHLINRNMSDFWYAKKPLRCFQLPLFVVFKPPFVTLLWSRIVNTLFTYIVW